MDEKHKTHDLSHGECAQCDDVLTNKKNKTKRTYTQMLVLMLLNVEVTGNGHVATSPRNHLKLLNSHFYSTHEFVVKLYNFIVTSFLWPFTAHFCTATHLKCCLHPPPPSRRLQWTDVNCKRSICNKVIEFKKFLLQRIVPTAAQQVAPSTQCLAHHHRDFHSNEESTINLANSTMKNSVPIVNQWNERTQSTQTGGASPSAPEQRNSVSSNN